MTGSPLFRKQVIDEEIVEVVYELKCYFIGKKWNLPSWLESEQGRAQDKNIF